MQEQQLVVFDPELGYQHVEHEQWLSEQQQQQQVEQQLPLAYLRLS